MIPVVARIVEALTELVRGHRMARTLRQNDRAADELDAALREVLKR